MEEDTFSESEYRKRYRDIGKAVHEIEEYHRSMRNTYLPLFASGVKKILLLASFSAVVSFIVLIIALYFVQQELVQWLK